MFSIDPAILKRYGDIARLLWKYGRADLVTQSGLDRALDGEEPLVQAHDNVDPNDLADDLERLGPTFVKLGQLLSTRADLLPSEYLQSLSRLQDRVGPVPFETIRQLLKDEYGFNPSKVFASIDERPMAAASLGQVHRAVLHDGMEVAVKVQRPNIKEEIDRDLRALMDTAQTLDQHTDAGKQFQFGHIVETLRHTLYRELDYLQEMENCRALGQALKDFHRIRVPQAISDYCTKRVLVMEFVHGVKIPDLDGSVLLEIDRRGLARELFDCYLHQVLVCRMFHADPHPGNILLTRDEKIALLDLGMVVRVPEKLQRQLLKLLLTISEGRGDETAKVAADIAVTHEDNDISVFKHRIAQLVSEHYSKPVEELQAGRIVMQIQTAAGQSGVYLPDELTMLGKTLMNLDRVISQLDPNFDPNAAMRKRARRLMQNQAVRQVSLGKLYQSLMDSSEFALESPERMNKIMELVAENQLQVHVNAIDERELIRGFQKVANRITTGLILAAIIIGASLMMRMESSLTIFGYPAIAVIFFVGAASLGLVLVYQTLRKDIA